MIAGPTQARFKQLNARRRRLGMSLAALAKRSGVSVPTVARILSGRHPHADIENVEAIAEALGMALSFTEITDVEDLRERQAEAKASQVVALLQGTSALEGQGLDEDTLLRMKRRTVHELLAGSRRALWSD